MVIGALRLAIGGLALVTLAGTRGSLRAGGRWALWPTLLAAVNVAAYQLFFFAGVARAGVAIGTIVGIGSAPVWGGVLGYVVRGERPSRRWGIATLLAIFGGSLLALPSGSITVDPLGLLLAIGAGLTYAAYTTASKGVLETQPPDAAMAVIFTLGALLLAPFFFTADLGWLLQPRGIIVALHLGIIATGLSYFFFARGLQTVPVATTMTLTLAEPLTAGLLGVFLLGEQLTPLALLGIFFLFAGLALLATGRRRKTHES
jgi:DME family drug/metabolite transporter